MFNGFTDDTFLFLLELRFNNNKPFFEENRSRYQSVLYRPMQALAEELLPYALKIDPSFNSRMTSIISRIHRDTRFSADKSPYRDHAWLGFRRPGKRLSESYCIYFEISPEQYGYGIGMYSGNPEMMKMLRPKILAAPSKFLAIVSELEQAGFSPEGESFKRDRFPDVLPELKPYLNRKGLSFCFQSTELKRAKAIEVKEEMLCAMKALGKMYQFLFPEADNEN